MFSLIAFVLLFGGILKKVLAALNHLCVDGLAVPSEVGSAMYFGLVMGLMYSQYLHGVRGS